MSFEGQIETSILIDASIQHVVSVCLMKVLENTYFK